jgi:hypothetical protein
LRLFLLFVEQDLNQISEKCLTLKYSSVMELAWFLICGCEVETITSSSELITLWFPASGCEVFDAELT